MLEYLYMKNSIYNNTKAILDSLKETDIFLGGDKFLNIVKDLKQTPRSGKLVRIKKYNLKLPCQSIYSHLLSMAYNGDIFQACLNNKLSKAQFDFTCCAIAFHDLSESIIGDVPMFTDKNLAGDHYKSARQKAIEEKSANNLIANGLSSKIKNKFIRTIKVFEDKDSKKIEFFLFLDKSEPITAIWKYIYLYKKDININKFLAAMSDFFLEKNLLPYCFNDQTKKVAYFLQSKKNAFQYYNIGSGIFNQFKESEISGQNLKKLIEGQKLYFTKN